MSISNNIHSLSTRFDYQTVDCEPYILIIQSYEHFTFEISLADKDYNDVTIGFYKTRSDHELRSIVGELAKGIYVQGGSTAPSGKTQNHLSLTQLLTVNPFGQSLAVGDRLFKIPDPPLIFMDANHILSRPRELRLLESIALGYWEGFESAVKEGTSLTIKDSRGWNALHWLCASHTSHAFLKILTVLFKHPHLLQEQDDYGETPLHLFLNLRGLRNAESATLIEPLLHAGADILLPNRRGETPLDLMMQSPQSVFKNLAAMFIEKQQLNQTLTTRLNETSVSPVKNFNL